jgi:potassium-transporting ATPase KdpC subunit
MRLPSWISQHIAALRAVLVFTVLCGLAYPLLVLGIAQLPGLRHNANGSLVTVGNNEVGSSIIGQAFTDKDGNPLKQYFQSRPSAAGDGYDPDATSASNLGPESMEDTNDKPSLLSAVCAQSKAVGELEKVDGRRAYCTPGGVGAVLRVFSSEGIHGTVTRAVSVNERCPATPFLTTYQGVTVECGKDGEDYSHGVLVPIRGDAPAKPAVPADAVTSSGSGLDPHISPAYAQIQMARVAQSRGISVDQVRALVRDHTVGRALGFMGEPAVNVLELNLALDRKYPFRG